MYISHIKVKGFRNFKDSDIEFNDGLNVLIGHNNAGNKLTEGITIGNRATL